MMQTQDTLFIWLLTVLQKLLLLQLQSLLWFLLLFVVDEDHG